MPARTPADVHHEWAAAFSARDLDRLMALYEPDATFVAQPGQTVAGTPAIRDALQGFLAISETFELEHRKVVQAGDLAIAFSQWTLRGKGPDGLPLSLSNHATDVVRRQPDGTWRIVIDNPFGLD